MPLLVGEKDPNDIVDLDLSWARELAGDAITTSTWIFPDGVTEGVASNTETTTKVRLSGGTVGQNYKVTNRVVTVSGQQMDQSITIYIRDH